jgi:hypothetical protein
VKRVVSKLSAAWCGWPCTSVAVLLAVIWLNELFDLHSKLFGAVPSRGEWSSALLLTLGVFAAWLVAAVPAYLRKKANGHHAVTVCSYCRRVQVQPEGWQHIEHAFADQTKATLSHGVCPDCGERVMSDYRNGKRNAGARATLPNEIMI